jgi:Flp pilus assembly pilin Flp
MKKIRNKAKVFLADEGGAETVEWVMITSVLAGLLAIVYWDALQNALSNAITSISTCIETPTSCPIT